MLLQRMHQPLSESLDRDDPALSISFTPTSRVQHQLFKQMEKKEAQKELIEILKKIQKGEQWKD
jgi:NADH:ubiquinone oxidoreductase subunit E